jgi:hypothetical protein
MLRWRLRAVANLVNLSTPLGLVVGALGGCTFRRGPRGLVLASGYRLPVPPAPAFTLGNVILTRHPAGHLESRPALLAHEERHSWQYVACLGLPMLPLYVAGCGWSWLRGGDAGVHNPFERLAGLSDGGYPDISARARRRQARPAGRPQPPPPRCRRRGGAAAP